MKVKLIWESFSPEIGEEFYYKPSEEWNYLVWCDYKYMDYLFRVYGEIPPRINPVKLHLVNQNNEIVFGDFTTELSPEKLQEILDSDGDCTLKIKKKENTNVPYLKGKKLYKRIK